MSFSDPVTAMFYAFTTDSALFALIGLRCFPRTATPETPARPYITYQRVSGTRDVELAGAIADHAGARFQVDIISDSYSAANLIAAAIRAICSRGGPLAGGNPQRWGYGLRRVTLAGGPRDLPQYEPGMGQATPYLTLDLMATYRES